MCSSHSESHRRNPAIGGFAVSWVIAMPHRLFPIIKRLQGIELNIPLADPSIQHTLPIDSLRRLSFPRRHISTSTHLSRLCSSKSASRCPANQSSLETESYVNNCIFGSMQSICIDMIIYKDSRRSTKKILQLFSFFIQYAIAGSRL